jgi:hypothetical protein
MPRIAGTIVDRRTGLKVEARVQVLTVEGRFLHPPDAILKVGNGLPFFYSDGEFALEAPWGATQVLVERGTEYVPARMNLQVPAHGTAAVEIALERWSALSEQGWHPGNTHIHYDQFETRPDERLRLDSRIEDLRVTAVSILKRGERDYAVNKYPVGLLTEFCSAHHHVECGEESRHNSRADSLDEGYGHIMLLRLRDVVEPISRGYLVDELDPDYPPLCYACDEAHRQGAIVIWCHNGRGLEAPVAAALNKLDAFNLFDPYWSDPEYALWYRLLNCGFRLPASTGSDWFLCSANRVYAYTGGPFDYATWIQALQAGRSFITNGPALELRVNDQMPGDVLRAEPGREVQVAAAWQSHHAIHRVEIVWNGEVAAAQAFPDGSTAGRLETGLRVPSDGWLAARLSSNARDSFLEPVFAHTSPVYVAADRPAAPARPAALSLEAAIAQALGTISTSYRFQNDQQRREVVDLFKRGQAVYQELARTGVL